MIVYIYDDKEGKTNAISIDKKNMVDEDLEFFNDHSIRKVWHSGEEEWYLSIVDVVQVLTDSSDPKQYIKKMRARDKALESKWGTICTPLQMLKHGWQKSVQKDWKKLLIQRKQWNVRLLHIKQKGIQINGFHNVSEPLRLEKN